MTNIWTLTVTTVKERPISFHYTHFDFLDDDIMVNIILWNSVSNPYLTNNRGPRGPLPRYPLISWFYWPIFYLTQVHSSFSSSPRLFLFESIFFNRISIHLTLAESTVSSRTLLMSYKKKLFWHFIFNQCGLRIGFFFISLPGLQPISSL